MLLNAKRSMSRDQIMSSFISTDLADKSVRNSNALGLNVPTKQMSFRLSKANSSVGGSKEDTSAVSENANADGNDESEPQTLKEKFDHKMAQGWGLMQNFATAFSLKGYDPASRAYHSGADQQQISRSPNTSGTNLLEQPLLGGDSDFPGSPNQAPSGYSGKSRDRSMSSATEDGMGHSYLDILKASRSMSQSAITKGGDRAKRGRANTSTNLLASMGPGNSSATSLATAMSSPPQGPSIYSNTSKMLRRANSKESSRSGSSDSASAALQLPKRGVSASSIGSKRTAFRRMSSDTIGLSGANPASSSSSLNLGAQSQNLNTVDRSKSSSFDRIDVNNLSVDPKTGGKKVQLRKMRSSTTFDQLASSPKNDGLNEMPLLALNLQSPSSMTAQKKRGPKRFNSFAGDFPRTRSLSKSSSSNSKGDDPKDALQQWYDSSPGGTSKLKDDASNDGFLPGDLLAMENGTMVSKTPKTPVMQMQTPVDDVDNENIMSSSVKKIPSPGSFLGPATSALQQQQAPSNIKVDCGAIDRLFFKGPFRDAMIPNHYARIDDAERSGGRTGSVCSICGDGFSSAEALMRHCVYVAEQNGEFDEDDVNENGEDLDGPEGGKQNDESEVNTLAGSANKRVSFYGPPSESSQKGGGPGNVVNDFVMTGLGSLEDNSSIGAENSPKRDRAFSDLSNNQLANTVTNSDSADSPTAFLKTRVSDCIGDANNNSGGSGVQNWLVDDSGAVSAINRENTNDNTIASRNSAILDQNVITFEADYSGSKNKKSVTPLDALFSNPPAAEDAQENSERKPTLKATSRWATALGAGGGSRALARLNVRLGVRKNAVANIVKSGLLKETLSTPLQGICEENQVRINVFSIFDKFFQKKNHFDFRISSSRLDN